jgi:thiosulfate reductase cytochrome b subunit
MKRHSFATRVWHWLNFACLAILFMSGLNISNAHPRLYWGDWGFDAATAWLAVPRFPGWMTIPGYYSLSGARDWHVLVAWPFAIGLALMWAAMLLGGHFRRDLVTRTSEWRWSAIKSDIAAHLRLDFDHGAGKFNFLQKITYGVVLGVLLPGMIVTGLGISPGIEPAVRPLIDLVGGRQSMRSLHFICAWSLFAFFVLHVALVLLSHPLKQMRDMIFGGRDAA